MLHAADHEVDEHEVPGPDLRGDRAGRVRPVEELPAVDEVRATFRELRRPQRARAATSGDRGPVALASFRATTW